MRSVDGHRVTSEILVDKLFVVLGSQKYITRNRTGRVISDGEKAIVYKLRHFIDNSTPK